MSVTLLSTLTGRPFADRLAARLAVAVRPVERQSFPDGEHYLRLPLEDPFELLGQRVVLVGPTDGAESLDEVFRLGCTAVKHGASGRDGLRAMQTPGQPAARDAEGASQQKNNRVLQPPP